MMSMIVKDVDERTPDFERRAQGARVVPLREDGATPAETGIETTRESDREALHRARKRALSVCFGNQVNVIRLHREVHETRAIAPLGSTKRAED
jgi:hypothetical protein